MCVFNRLKSGAGKQEMGWASECGGSAPAVRSLSVVSSVEGSLNSRPKQSAGATG